MLRRGKQEAPATSCTQGVGAGVLKTGRGLSRQGKVVIRGDTGLRAGPSPIARNDMPGQRSTWGFVGYPVN